MSRWWCLLGIHYWKRVSSGPYEQIDVVSNRVSKKGIWVGLECECCGDVKMRKLI